MSTKPKKLRRVTQACDFCNKRSIQCAASPDDDTRCQNCVDFALPCTYERPTKRRGVRGKSTSMVNGALPNSPTSTTNGSTPTLHQPASIRMDGAIPRAHAPPHAFHDDDDDEDLPGWKARVVASHATILALVDIYFEVVYPIFPLFHRPTLLRKLSRREYLTDRGFYAAVMATCALASARARDGALFSEDQDPSRYAEPPSEAFFAAAKDVMPKDFSLCKGFGYSRACALLAITGIQYGQIDALHQYLGTYHSLLTMETLHDEAHWPSGIGLVETEERRRLFWSIYTLEIYSSIVWGGIIRCREAHSRVQYPVEVDDEDFDDDGFHFIAPPAGVSGLRPVSWLRGWNFTTDLYRILEHAIDQFRTRRLQSRSISSATDLFRYRAPPEASVLEAVSVMFASLPQQFKEILPVTMDSTKDRYSFQAANITATIQLVHMLLFTPDEVEVEQKCNIASDLLAVFANVPIEYLRTISSPFLHYFAGIGSILGSVIEGPLSESSYLRVRSILLAMARLLASLESGLYRTAGASERLRKHVTRIDEYMENQRNLELASQHHMLHGLPTNQSGQPNPVATDFQFQLPDEFRQAWPWPFYSAQNSDLLPLRFDWDMSST
ncbi:hypothetical protein MMC13_006084 [Lambiella insularis]|nr:hypothetical protein [Lambiella insularis]